MARRRISSCADDGLAVKGGRRVPVRLATAARTRAALALTAVVVLAGGVLAPAAQAVELPTLTGVSFPTDTQDVTLGPGSLAVTVTARDADSAYAALWVRTGTVGTDRVEQIAMPRIAGTFADGTYRVTLPLPAGTSSTWGVQVSLFGPAAGDVWNADRLAAAGFPSTVTTRTTAAPPAPRNLRVTTGWRLTFGLTLQQTWTATYAQTSGRPQAAEWLIATSGKCRPENDTRTFATTFMGYPNSTGAGSCRVSVKARNAAGTSAASTGTVFFV